MGQASPLALLCFTAAPLALLRPLAFEPGNFKVSRDKNFAAKVADVVGLYLNLPDKALLCIDEKSQIQALDRTQPGLPMSLRRPRVTTPSDEGHRLKSGLAALCFSPRT
jgi:hypothetical protein